jgi:microsomal dipeptidase-like Zn-dependent dipeptidase
MSYLGFGGKAVHGAPDVGLVIPSGMYGCEPQFRGTHVSHALGHCNGTHGGWGTDNGCGDTLRAALITHGIEKDFWAKANNVHGDHYHPGYPNFTFWPHQTSRLHQQMWWEWIERAHEGGLRVMVALTVNSETLAALLNGDRPYDDKSVADEQIDQTIRMVENHDFMEIATSPADARQIIREGKLAVILGMEVDRLGNLGRRGFPATAASVHRELRRLHGKGIRYIFPIHLIDNAFGGAAVYDLLFNFANKHVNGSFFSVAGSPDPNIVYDANEKSDMRGLHGLLKGLGYIPAPCMDFPSCFPPKVACCGSYATVLEILEPEDELNDYNLFPLGHANELGLTNLGQIAVSEMMRLGMIIDLDHMSERTMTDTIELAERISGGYPLVLGHNSIRVSDSSERMAPRWLLERVALLGGMVGLGTAKATPESFVHSYGLVREVMGPGNVGIGTDVNGFELLPRNAEWCVPNMESAKSRKFYDRFLRESGIHTKSRLGNRTWDYVNDCGVAHYGLMPEFFFDIRTFHDGNDVYDDLMRSAEHFVQMWERIEVAADEVDLRAAVPGLRAPVARRNHPVYSANIPRLYVPLVTRGYLPLFRSGTKIPPS